MASSRPASPLPGLLSATSSTTFSPSEDGHESKEDGHESKENAQDFLLQDVNGQEGASLGEGERKYHEDQLLCQPCSSDKHSNDDTNDDIMTDEKVAQWLSLDINNGNPTSTPIRGTVKRANYLSWDDYFMAVAILSAMRSKEPSSPSLSACSDNCSPFNSTSLSSSATRGGACIVHSTNHRILAVGYSGFTASDDVLPWQDHGTSKATSTRPWLWTRHPYVVPAAVNAILNTGNNLEGAKLYVTQFPDPECAKTLIQAGIRHVIYKRHPNDNVESDDKTKEAERRNGIRASRILMHLAGVKVEAFRPSRREPIQISLSSSPPSTTTKLNQESTLKGNARQRGWVVAGPSQSWGSVGKSVFQTIWNWLRTALTFVKNIFCQIQEQAKQRSSAINNDDNGDDDPRYKYRALLRREAHGYDPVTMPSGRRKDDVLTWTDYFMSLACLTAQRSKDPNTQVGACLVDSQTNRICGLGYNGMPTDCSDDVLPWGRGDGGSNSSNMLLSKYVYVCHAEVNAILNRIPSASSSTTSSTTLYVALFPCHNCAKFIVQAACRIRKIVYQEDKYHDTDSCRASRILLSMAGIELEQYVPPSKNISISLLK